MEIIKQKRALSKALLAIIKGKVIICPTDTVYGFLADASNKKAVENDDIFTANNLKHDMLFNYVSSAVKANRFDMRIDELESAKHLTGEEFKKMWGENYNDVTGQDATQYLDSVKLGRKYGTIKKDHN